MMLPTLGVRDQTVGGARPIHWRGEELPRFGWRRLAFSRRTNRVLPPIRERRRASA